MDPPLQPKLMSLPDECLECVCGFLDPASVVSLGGVSAVTRALTRRDALWERLCCRDWAPRWLALELKADLGAPSWAAVARGLAHFMETLSLLRVEQAAAGLPLRGAGGAPGAAARLNGAPLERPGAPGAWVRRILVLCLDAVQAPRAACAAAAARALGLARKTARLGRPWPDSGNESEDDARRESEDSDVPEWEPANAAPADARFRAPREARDGEIPGTCPCDRLMHISGAGALVAAEARGNTVVRDHDAAFPPRRMRRLSNAWPPEPPRAGR
jgi:hypothetical protein